MWRPVTHNLVILSCGVCLLVSSGCSAFRSGVQDTLVAQQPRHLPPTDEPSSTGVPPADPLAAVRASSNAEPDVASCYVEIRASGDEPNRIRMSLDDAAYVQNVLEQTGLVKKFRNMQIELSRKLADGTRHKMEVRYDSKKKSVVPAYDYALHPDDLLVIRKDTSTSFDEMLKKLAGPLAR